MTHETLPPKESQKKILFYHGSPKRLRHGEILLPGNPIKFGNIETSGVFLTTSPIPHYTIVEDVLSERKSWHIYEVQPYGRVEYGLWDDAVADRARIIRYIGNARGILNSKLKHFKNKGESITQAGSKVWPEVNLKDVNARLKRRNIQK